jgi:disulfide oxidoreductase YuzD
MQTIKKNENIWLAEPEAHDYPAAADYLDLLYSGDTAENTADHLKKCPTVIKKAKDILRASELPLLPADNTHVKDNIQKVQDGKKLSPVLLVRGRKLIIADGYHRVCAAYYLSEDLQRPCRITDLKQ